MHSSPACGGQRCRAGGQRCRAGGVWAGRECPGSAGCVLYGSCVRTPQHPQVCMCVCSMGHGASSSTSSGVYVCMLYGSCVRAPQHPQVCMCVCSMGHVCELLNILRCVYECVCLCVFVRLSTSMCVHSVGKERHGSPTVGAAHTVCLAGWAGPVDSRLSVAKAPSVSNCNEERFMEFKASKKAAKDALSHLAWTNHLALARGQHNCREAVASQSTQRKSCAGSE